VFEPREETLVHAQQNGLSVFIILSMLLHVFLFALVSRYQTDKPEFPSEPVLVRLFQEIPVKTVKRSVEPVTDIAPDHIEKDFIEESMPAGTEVKTQDGATIKQEAVIKESSLPASDLLPESKTMETQVFDSLDPLDPSKIRANPLFDSEIIARHALDPALKEENDSGITFDTNGIAISGYLGRLKHKVESNWSYPYAAAKDGKFGDVLISIIIRRNGTLGEVRVIRTSGHVELDEAALNSLRAAEPFWPLPEGFSKEALQINGRFIYSRYGRYLR
jgi:TonB family protein